MAEIRNTTINIDATKRTQMQNATDHNEWFRAIGYLSTWNMIFPQWRYEPTVKRTW